MDEQVDIVGTTIPDARYLILDKMHYKDLKRYALTSRSNLEKIREYIAHVALIARDKLGSMVPEHMTSRELVERIYHLNFYKNANMDGILITPQRAPTQWSKGNNVIRLHLENNPAGVITQEANLLGMLHHRYDAPGKTRWQNGVKIAEYWYMADKLHRIGAPAITRWKDGEKVLEQWYVDGKLHRIDGAALQTWTDKTLTSESWHKDGVPHRIGGPAVRLWVNGKLTSERWYKDGKPHRIGGPDVRTWLNGALTSEEWHVDGKLHRIGGAARQTWTDGTLTSEGWYVDGKLHRIDGPALAKWKDGTLTSAEWYIDGKFHRIDGPAYQVLIEELLSEKWYVNGVQHRVDGPAEIFYRDDGTKIENWYIDGKNLTADEIKKHKQERREALRGRTREQCTKTRYLDEDDHTRPYTKDQLYFMAKGMNLPATRRMTKDELCQLIATGIKQSPF